MGLVGYGVNNSDDLKKAILSTADVLNDGGCFLVAYESKFGIDVDRIVVDSKIYNEGNNYGLRNKIILENDFYRFYFYKKIK